MSSASLAALFLPEWALPWVMVLGAAAWITGARALAAGALAVVIADLIVAPLVAPALAELPGWIFLPILAVLALGVLHRVVTLLFGRETAGQVTGGILLGALRMIFVWPFQFLGLLIRLALSRERG